MSTSSGKKIALMLKKYWDTKPYKKEDKQFETALKIFEIKD